MTKEDLINMAIWIRYPLENATYKSYTKQTIDLPINRDMMYSHWGKNTNHFTTEYHRLYSLPLLEELLKFNYSEKDFYLEERKSSSFDISMLHPNKNFMFETYGFDANEHLESVDYNTLTRSETKDSMITDYHRLYRYPHQCSRVINKTLEDGRRLMVSGDSQMIPDIPILCCYFKEVWYMDNRFNKLYSNLWKDVEFTDCLIELNCNDLKKYTELNFK